MTAEIVTLHQVAVEAPPAFSAAINADLLQKIRMAPVPVLFLNAPDGADWAGYCGSHDQTENGEVVLDSKLVETCLRKPNSQHIVEVYLHESAHRLMPGHWHNAAFFCMNFVLHLRAGKLKRPVWHGIKFYDIQDEIDFESPGRFFQLMRWAWLLAVELAETEETAEESATLIHQKYQEFCEWLDAADEREEAATQRRTAAVQHLRNIESDLADARADRLLHFVFGGVAGLLVATFFLWG